MVFSSLRFLGGFAAALIDDPLWVMNTVPIEAEFNTLGVIYERGLIGTYQNWFMADPSTPTRPQSEDQSQSSTQPKCRRATRLKDLTVSRNVDQKLPIQFDMSTGKVIGDNRARFTSFVALLGRSIVSILTW
ncbi:hypothetical protein VIGAN_08245300 [Vigna angularis var. angularis]|uniref:Methyltransferase n=1 Tax=Vigna angularis var. angularis TaxID=157739 RepID=A0A0S3RYR6_PHAAN|nr:hypothetical protein VIGAN_04331100 [Vigna angularis var. angularis]BAT95687.1 hypothetical protein VIGAN_08245300 [Vigna angularis var. angularis]